MLGCTRAPAAGTCRYHYHLEAARFMEKPQLLYLLQLLRDSLERSAARLPCVISVFLAKCSRTMIKPSTC